jgi:hypothetical protein
MDPPEKSSTRIADLPQDNITISYRNRDQSDMREADMASASYMQINMHQNPYGQGIPGIMPPPAYNSRPSQPDMPAQTYNPRIMDDSEYLGRPSHPLSQRDIHMSMDEFRDERATPNYVPPPSNLSENFVQDQEDRLRAQKISENTKKTVQDKMDWIAQMQTPILLAVLFWLFTAEIVNTLMGRYLSALGLFSENGNLNFQGTLFKSGLFGAFYYGITVFLNNWEDLLE